MTRGEEILGAGEFEPGDCEASDEDDDAGIVEQV